MNIQEQKYYDVKPGSDWFCRFDVLLLKNEEHRKILNRQPTLEFWQINNEIFGVFTDPFQLN